MKKVFLIIFVLYIIGCIADSTNDTPENVKVIEIDGCQYIACYRDGYGMVAICHKGNCNNVQHKEKR